MSILFRRVIVAVGLVASAHVAWAQTAEEVIEKSVTAMGGRAAHAKLKSRASAGTITLSTPGGEITGSVEVWNAPPNKSRTVIKADLTALGAGPMTMDQRFDGTAGYVLDNLQGNRDVTGNQLDNLRNGGFPHPFLNYKELGTTVKLGGKDKIGERDAFVVTFDPTSGSAVRVYVDAENYLPLRSTVKVEVPQLGQTIEQSIDFLDYREVDGVKIPFQLNASSAVQNFTIKLTKVEHNGEIDATMFSKPKQ